MHMQEAKYLKSCGLSAEQGELLRALFQSGFDASPLPAWVASGASAAVVLTLRRAGLVNEHTRLTMAGLVVAAGLARAASDRVQRRSGWPRAA
jgi:hypothetical protein